MNLSMLKSQQVFVAAASPAYFLLTSCLLPACFLLASGLPRQRAHVCLPPFTLLYPGKELLRKLGSMIPNLKARKESGGKPKLPALPPGYVAMGPGAGVEAPASPAAPLPQSSPAAGGSGNRQSGGNSKKKGKR